MTLRDEVHEAVGVLTNEGHGAQARSVLKLLERYDARAGVRLVPEGNKSRIAVDWGGQEGNIWFIMGAAGRFLSNEERAEMSKRVVQAKSYGEALDIVEEYVTIENRDELRE